MEIDFQALRENAAGVLAMRIDELSAKAPRTQLIHSIQEICLYFHQLGVASLLLDGYPTDFFANLYWAADAWRRLLEHLSSRGEAPPPATWNAPLLGAIMAEQWNLASRIVRASARVCQQHEGEYEDDFDWAMLLGHMAALPRDSSLLEQLVDRLERSGGRAASDRVALARALLARDQQQFFEAFRGALTRHGQDMEPLATKSTAPLATLAPYRYLWFEGLALLRMGEQAGLVSDEPFLYCPTLARVRLTRIPSDSWHLPLGTKL